MVIQGVLPIVGCRGRFHPKGVPFQARSLLMGRETCHSTDTFQYGIMEHLKVRVPNLVANIHQVLNRQI